MRDPVNMHSSIYNLVCSSTTVSQSISLPFFLFSYVLDGLSWKEPYDQRQNPNSFYKPTSIKLVLFYLYLLFYFIISSHNNNYHNISNESLIELIRQLILTFYAFLTHGSHFCFKGERLREKVGSMKRCMVSQFVESAVHGFNV